MRWRHPTLDDAPRILDLVVACDEAAVGTSEATLTQVVGDLGSPAYEAGVAGRLVEDGRGTAIGWLWTELDDAKGEVFLDPYSLDPDVLRWLVGEAVTYATGLAAARGRAIGIAGGSYEGDAPLAEVLGEAGLQVRRRFWRMRIDLDAVDPASPDPGPGVEIVRVADDEPGLRLLHRLNEETFAEHWDHAVHSFDDWRRDFDARPGRDPSAWWVAVVDGEPAGLVVGDESQADLGVSYVRTLGVLREARGRGVGTALLRTAFAEARRRGRSAVALSVDSENATGALRLYESVGMHCERAMLAWRGSAGVGG